MVTHFSKEAFGLRTRILANLSGFERQSHQDPNLTPAAVAVMIVQDERHPDPCFVITRRTSKLRQHPGQWALPGGRLDEGEDARSAALRETHEELGVSLDPNAILGLLDDYPTRSGYAITPVVVWSGSNLAMSPNPDEVAEVYWVPLSDLERPEVPRLRAIEESDRPVISVPIPMRDANVHAPTAAILYQLREVALHGRATRVDHFEQPVFAWR
ncbi:CoA pyrophosphatase [Myxococcota bacterium]|nr:CoA pyrophosphatase [Myxococcota bacterium]